MFKPRLLQKIRDKFHHIDTCPYQGRRVFFENAGGSLTLKSVVATNAELSAIPDNQGRDNPASVEMVRRIAQGKDDMRIFLGAPDDGVVFIGESGTECLFRMIRAACNQASSEKTHGQVIGSTLEHPATSSAASQWAQRFGLDYIAIPHDPQSGSVSVDAYRPHLSENLRVATIIQTSPVSGIGVDIAAIAAAIREVAPHCFIIVDGIQHAPHGSIHLADYGIDGYAVSGYKVFSRHNYGFAWVSNRLAHCPHDRLDGTSVDTWELGTRDASAYASFSEVVKYLEWLGGECSDANQPRARIIAAAQAIAAHETHLSQLMLHGDENQKGLADMARVFIIGGAQNPRREGLVSLSVDGVGSEEVVRELGERGVRVHVRKRDYYSEKILIPLELDTCVRVSMAHYNSPDEVLQFLGAMQEIVEK